MLGRAASTLGSGSGLILGADVDTDIRTWKSPILIYRLIYTHYLHWSLQCNYQNISIVCQLGSKLNGTWLPHYKGIYRTGMCLHVFDSFAGWNQVVLRKLSQVQLTTQRFVLLEDVGALVPPHRWSTASVQMIRALPFSMQEKKAWSCSYTDDRESDSYGCNRLTNDDASWYVLLISKCLLRHIVWSIKCWIQWKIPIRNWRSRWLFIF